MLISEQLRQILATRYHSPLRQQLDSVLAKADWPSLTQEATNLGLAPLFYDVLRNNNVSGLPDTAVAHLQRNYMTVGLRNAMTMTALADILQRLNAANIRAIVLKGAALATTVYGNLAVRDMQDVDLLLPPDQMQMAISLLEEMGFGRDGVDLFPAGSPLGWHATLLEKPGSPTLLVELHSRLLQSAHYATRPGFAALYERSLSIEIEGIPTRTLAPDDQLLHLCGHAMAHHGGALASVGPDIAHVIARYQAELDWERLLVTAQANDWVMSLQTVLLSVVEDWWVSVPAGMTERIKQLKPRSLERFLNYCHSRNGWQQLSMFVASPQRWHYLKTLLFPPPHYMSVVWDWQPMHSLLLAYLKRFKQLITQTFSNE